MKKRFLAIVIIATFLLSACGKVTQVKPNQQSGTSPSVAISPSSAVSVKPYATASTVEVSAPVNQAPSAVVTNSQILTSAGQTSPSYSIETATFSQDDIHIEYPQIKGLGDDKRVKAINDLIKNDILDYLVKKPLDYVKEYNPDSETDFKLHIDADSQIAFSSNEILSISYGSSIYYTGWHHPQIDQFGITIDLKTAKVLHLTDFVKIDEGLIQVIKQSPSLACVDAIFYVQRKDNQKLVEELNSYSDRDFYLTPSSIVISVYVPHVVGDRALAEIQGNFTCFQPSTLKPDRIVNLDSEYLLLGFQIEDSQKRLSICISNDKKPYIVYRFSTNDNIEFEFPINKENSWTNFKFIDDFKNNSDYLSFTNNGFEYQVYQMYQSNGSYYRVGIKVTELSNGKVTDIKGDSTSVIGNLSFLREYADYIKANKLS